VETIEQSDRAGPSRAWAPTIGLLLLGLAIAGVANAPGLQGDPGPTLRAVGSIGYVVGMVVFGFGLQRALWSPRSTRTRAVRLVVTALLVFPAFLAAGIFVSLVLTLIQLRSPF
jgi:hypothetical protein